MRHIPLKLLSDFVDERYSGNDRKLIESHLDKCDSCRRALLLLKNSDTAIRNLEGVKTSPAFDNEFDRKLNEKIEFKEERKLSYIMSNIFEKVKESLIIPAPVLASAIASLLFVIFAYGILTYSLVASPDLLLVKGSVSIYSAKQQKWITQIENLKLSKGDIIKLGKGSIADISHPNKYTLRIKENSQVRIAKLLPRYINGRVIYRIEKGKTLVSIDASFKGSKFIVKTPEATATALGTAFLVDVSTAPSMMTRLGVLKGKVGVESLFKPEERPESQKIVVDAGEATEIYKGRVPLTPRQLLDKEWQEMVEFYQIGEKPQVALLISSGKHRTRELLRPCSIYISDVEPRTLSESLEETIRIIDEAIKTKDTNKHLEGIKRLERILNKYPNPNYEPQLLLFIGSYYNYLHMYTEAISSFQKVADKYPDSTFASMTLYAIGIIYDEELNDKTTAEKYYNLVLTKYPKSPEAQSLLEKK